MEIQDQLNAFNTFLKNHPTISIKDLPFRVRSESGFSAAFGVAQLKGRAAISKFGALTENPDFVFPPSISIEQSSSTATADFKSALFSGKRMADLTAGMGIDTFAWAKSFEEVCYVDQNQELTQIATHNASALGITNVQFHTLETEAFLNTSTEYFDLIYLDPSRRGTSQEKLVSLSDLSPNVLPFLPRLIRLSRKVLIKLSPMLDIHLALQELGQVSNIWVVSVKNECKELLFQLEESAHPPSIHCIDLYPDKQHSFTYATAEERNRPHIGCPLGTYIYDPNVSIRKTRLSDEVAAKYSLCKLHLHTTLFTSDQLIDSFPGRIFEVLATLKPDKKNIQKYLPDGKAMIITRNFPSDPKTLRSKWKIKDGGIHFLIATTLSDETKRVLLCKRVTA